MIPLTDKYLRTSSGIATSSKIFASSGLKSVILVCRTGGGLLSSTTYMVGKLQRIGHVTVKGFVATATPIVTAGPCTDQSKPNAR